MTEFYDLVKDIFECDDTFKSSIISREQIEGRLSRHPSNALGKSLMFGKNGIGNRYANGKFAYAVFYGSGKYRIYPEEVECDMITPYNLDRNDRGTKILYVQLLGKIIKPEYRRVPKDIKAHFKNSRCILCGTRANVIPDHKDGLYRREATELNEFQPLCIHHNFVKRQRYIDFKKSGNMESLSISTIGFLRPLLDMVPEYKEEEMEACFWYDPEASIKNIVKLIKNEQTNNTL